MSFIFKHFQPAKPTPAVTQKVFEQQAVGQKKDFAETTLLMGLRQGKSTASREWFRRYYPLILKFVSHKVSHQADAEELVQETFLNCLKHLPVFNGKSSIKTWMESIARHEIADYYRKKYAKKIIRTLPLHELVLAEPIHDASQISTQVSLVLKKMRRDYQELLWLKYVDRKKVKIIAQELGRTIKAVEADLFRARQDFKELYATINPN